MVSAPTNRRIAIAVLFLAAVLAISLTDVGMALQQVLYVGYSLAIPVMFGAFVLASGYFGLRHLLTS